MSIEIVKGGFKVVRTITTLLMLIQASHTSSSQSKQEKVRKLMEAYHQTGQFSGVVLVADSGKVIFEEAYGFADYYDSTLLNTDNRFRISSMTKQFTAMLILQLAEEDKLDLDSNISSYLGYYDPGIGSQVKLHHLLSHQSGIPSISGYPNFRRDSIRIPLPLEFLISHWCMGELKFTPGSETEYSNSNYMILGAILEKIEGKPYADILHKRILDPLEMKSSGLVPDSARVQGMPEGFVFQESRPDLESQVAYSNLHAAGQIYSTAGDLYSWDRALSQNLLLDQPWQAKMFTPYLNNFGYGWKVYRRKYEGQEDSCTTSYHAGGFEGFSSFIQRFHEREMVMILLSNTNRERKKMGVITDDIIKIVFHLPYELPVKRKAIDYSTEETERITGKYYNKNGDTISIENLEQGLIYISERGRRSWIYRESPNRYFFGKENRWVLDFSLQSGMMELGLNLFNEVKYFKKADPHE